MLHAACCIMLLNVTTLHDDFPVCKRTVNTTICVFVAPSVLACLLALAGLPAGLPACCFRVGFSGAIETHTTHTHPPIVDHVDACTHAYVTEPAKKHKRKKQAISYAAERVIGNGSFGVVYQATVIETGDTVAIKKVLQDRRFKVRICFFFAVAVCFVFVCVCVCVYECVCVRVVVACVCCPPRCLRRNGRRRSSRACLVAI
jgi:hypothetical protein